jgi:tripartite-type tricarboxylate transporter receptor subunit TctC
MGQPVIIDNKPGAGGNLGMELGAKSPNDGYTLILAPGGNLTVAPYLYAKPPYDPEKDFTPITVIAGVPNILVVNPGVPARSLSELVALAKSKPGTLNYASSGNGSLPHLAAELFKSMAEINVVHIPFNGVGPATTALLAGSVQVYFAPITAVLQHIKTGKMVALGVASPRRTTAAPELPTLSESGLPGFDVVSWYAIVAPAGTAPAIVTKIQTSVAAALARQDVREKLASLGAEPIGNTPDEFAAMRRSESARWQKVVKDSAIRLD